jgi:hypothetical protein
LDEPNKQWKFSPSDVAERQHWDEYQRAYEDAITATSTKHAPWYVIPADHKPVARAMVVGVLLDTIAALDLKWPRLGEERLAELAEARRQLEADPDDYRRRFRPGSATRLGSLIDVTATFGWRPTLWPAGVLRPNAP